MPTDCAQELCPNWSGDGQVCVCVMFDLEPPHVDPYGQSYATYALTGDQDGDEETDG